MAATPLKTAQAIRGRRVYTVTIWQNCATVVWQPLNPKTQKAWQAKRQIAYFSSDDARYDVKAYVAWTKAAQTPD